MKKRDFYYELPEKLIAQKPTSKRSGSRLMVVDKKTCTIEHKVFSDIVDYFECGDCLVINNTRVLKARLFGHKRTGAKVEVFLLHPLGDDKWEVLVKPGRKMKVGEEAVFSDKSTYCKVLEEKEDGVRVVEFVYQNESFDKVLDDIGTIPLPPYIDKMPDEEDEERYQTVYSQILGSVAAPTAGLHFTEELLEKLKRKGVGIAEVTLHVGLGTFRPVKADNIEEHIMHSEYYELSQENADIINAAKKCGKKVISVGTTSTRVLESVYKKNGELISDSGYTDIFITPGYEFGVVTALITNFHLPESTLIMLVSAFYEREKVLDVYKTAVDEKYRFFSYGDAMLLY